MSSRDITTIFFSTIINRLAERYRYYRLICVRETDSTQLIFIPGETVVFVYLGVPLKDA